MLDQIIRFSLRNRLLVLASAAFFVVYGSMVFVSLPVDVFPDLNRPVVTIMSEAPGMAPEEVETRVTLPVEQVMNGLPGVERVRSSSGIGLSVVYVEFQWGTDVYLNRQLVNEKLILAGENLPAGVAPILAPISSIMGEIMLVGLTADEKVSPLKLRELADWTIRPRLMAIPGVSQVIAIGGGVRQYQILLSAEKLQSRRLTMEEIEHALAEISQNTTGGYIDIGDKENLIRTIGMAGGIEDLRNSLVGTHLGRPVYVRDVAEVREGPRTKRGDASVNGKASVILNVQKQPGADTITLTEAVESALAEMSASLPAGVTLEKALFRQASFIESALLNVKHALRDGFILVVIVLFLFLLNFRTTFITLTAIPLSLVLTFIVFKLMDLQINTMTLGGLAVAIGELVDDAIVDVENVFRRLRENRVAKNPLPAMRVIFQASSEVRNSIVFATIIVVLVFIPLFSMGGIEGRLFSPLGIAYVVSLLASMLVSLTVTPVLCYFLLAKFKAREEKDGALVLWLKKKDKKILEWALDHPSRVLGGAVALFVLSLGLLPFFGSDFLPKFNEGTATVNLYAVPGISLEASNRLGTAAEKKLLEIPEVKSVARRTGRAEMDEHAEGVHYTEIDVDFKDGGRDRVVVFEEMREKLENFEGVAVAVGQPISHRLDHLMSGVRAQIAIKIFGDDLRVLRMKAAEVFEKIKNIPGVVDAQVEPQVLIPQVKIHLLREEAAQNNLASGHIAQVLEKALNGETVAQVIEGRKIVDVFMRFDEKSRSDIETISNTLLTVRPDGDRVTLGDVADVFESTGPNIINRENAQRRIVVSANASGRDISGVVGDMKKAIKAVEFPEGFFFEIGGQYESQMAARKKIFFLGLLSLVGILFVLYMHFRSFFISFQVMLNIPMALIGSLVAIYVSERTFSVATLVAFVTLCGIASRNGIMMISHYLHLMKHEGEGFTREMVVRGSLERLVPVLMTALTAILALLPLAIAHGEPGKEILHPVAVVIVGGLLSSTLLDIVVTPVVFWKYGRRSAEKALRLMEKKEEI